MSSLHVEIGAVKLDEGFGFLLHVAPEVYANLRDLTACTIKVRYTIAAALFDAIE